MEPDSAAKAKLNTYSLKVEEATRKFSEAFQLSKRYKKAVNRMRYEFTAQLSIDQKRLLEKEQSNHPNYWWCHHFKPIQVDRLFRVQRLFYTQCATIMLSVNFSNWRSISINYSPVPLPHLKPPNYVQHNLHVMLLRMINNGRNIYIMSQPSN